MSNGIPPQAFEFYQALTLDNSKEFWAANKADYERFVRKPLLGLLNELEPEFGPATMFRPYRDVRFSKDKSPYKLHQGAYVGRCDGVGFYVQISADAFTIGGGWYTPVPAQIAAYRRAVDSERGVILEGMVSTLRADGFAVEGDLMKTQPRGFAADHPRIELLRHRTVLVTESHDDIDSFIGDAALVLVQTTWQQVRPLIDWLAEELQTADA